eukprot:gene2725-3920_t
MTIQNPPRESKTVGKLMWKQKKTDENKLICIQRYEAGPLGKTFRTLIKKFQTKHLNFFFVKKFYFELATADTLNEILKDYHEILSALPSRLYYFKNQGTKSKFFLTL